MKKFIFVLIILTSSVVILSGQTIETVGAGVAEFLLSSPKTANKMNHDQQIALGIIGKLLETAGQRKHELNVAQAGKTEITVNTNAGQQLQLVMDQTGNVYAISNGIIYPISKSVVDQAKEFVLNQQPGYMEYVKNNSSNNIIMLPDYDVFQLKNLWDKEPPQELTPIYITEDRYLNDILKDYKLRLENIYCQRDMKVYQLTASEQNLPYIENKTKVKMVKANGSDRFGWAYVAGFSSYLYYPIYSNQIRGTFTARWAKDVNKDNDLQFNEFQDIRRNFFSNESFVITAGFYSPKKYLVKLNVYKQLTGDLVYSDEILNLSNILSRHFTFQGNFFKPGIYVYYISFINLADNLELERLSDKFQILSTEEVEEVPANTKTKGLNISPNTNSSKAKMMNDLIQLLKEGKISEETFNSSMKALEDVDR
jgi:hypothetical protein